MKMVNVGQYLYRKSFRGWMKDEVADSQLYVMDVVSMGTPHIQLQRNEGGCYSNTSHTDIHQRTRALQQ